MEGKIVGRERGLVVRRVGFFPVLIGLQDGRLSVVFRAGAPHTGVGGRLDLAFSHDGGRTWSEPQMVVYMPPDSRNPAFGEAADGSLIVAFSVTGPYPKGRWDNTISGRFTLWLTVSEDQGISFNPPTSLPVSPLRYGSPFGKIIHLSDGGLLLPVYQWDTIGSMGSYLYKSDDGKNWEPFSAIAKGHNETALAVLPDDRLLAVMRTDEEGLSEAYSEDGGHTWTKPAPLLDRGFHPPDLIKLPSGRILLTFGRRVEPFGAEAVLGEPQKDRVHWLWSTRSLIADNCANMDCGYPSSWVTADGTIVTVYYGVGTKDDSLTDPFCAWVRYREEDLLR
ncbi:MAG: glycoside hydrolase [Armatimonadetes bacterium]|nr:glycoside hydrolase [Armatimonadota bacterium]